MHLLQILVRVGVARLAGCRRNPLTTLRILVY